MRPSETPGPVGDRPVSGNRSPEPPGRRAVEGAGSRETADRDRERRPYRAPPARVRGNDWKSLRRPDLDSFVPAYGVSVVVPYYERPGALALTLAGIERQTYPRHLIEVVVVDDGSDPPLAPPETPLDLRVEYQEDLGFGLARARNTGARAATGDILVFLDCDMIPEADWLAAHARWHHAASDVLTMGFRLHVEVDGIDAAAVRTREGALANLFEGREVTRPEWIEIHMERTGDLTSDNDDLFRVVTGGNFGISRRFFETVGGFDETFTQWGAEDREFSYRAHAMGSLLVPERKALCWHQGGDATHSVEERSSLELQFAKMSHLVAHQAYRRHSAGRSFTIPQYVVTLRPGRCTVETVLTNAEQILASRVSDLVVWIDRRPGDASFEWLRRQLAPDPRVVFGPEGGAIDRFPVSPFHVTIECGAGYDSGMIGRLRAGLGDAASGRALFTEGPPVTIVRSWAWHRARHAGVELAEVGEAVEFAERNHVPDRFERLEALMIDRFEEMEEKIEEKEEKIDERFSNQQSLLFTRFGRLDKTIDGRFRRVHNRFGKLEKQTWHRLSRIEGRVAGVEGMIASGFGYRSRLLVLAAARICRRFLSELAGIRSPSDARRFVRWFFRAVAARFASKTVAPPGSGVTPSRREAPPGDRRRAFYTLGADIVAIGARAETVFAASGRVRNDLVGDVGHPDFPYLGGHHLDLLVVDSQETLDGIEGRPPPSAPILKLSEASPMLSVPAFDPERINPIGWTPDHVDEVASQSPSDGSTAPAPGNSDPATLRHFHHLDDQASYHPGHPERAAALAALAAAGVVVHLAEPDPELEAYLGKHLYGLMAGARVAGAGTQGRELLSIAMRREALRTHSLRCRARHALSEAGLAGAGLPEVSVLLPTRRPEQLVAAVKAVARQRYPRLQLVLGLHGAGFDDRLVTAALEPLGVPVELVRIEEEAPLGTVLNATVAASSGTLLAKMDDDDAYSAEHIWDLVLAYEYSGAELVAKASEYVYLSGMDKTVRLADRHGERYVKTRSVSGGVVMISRHDLAGAGGWRRMPRQVDLALAEDVLHAGGKIYWTHGAGYVRIRHGGGHTWKMHDKFFLDRASAVRDGHDLAFAGF